MNWTAVVLAGSRGAADPVAQASGVSHKAFADIAGKPMIAHVLDTLAAAPSIDGIVVLIAGGEAKGGDFNHLSAALTGRLRAAVLFGSDADKIAQALGDQAPVHIVNDIKEAVVRAARFAQSGDTVLLAPACASFDQFPNFEVRGDAFGEAVLGLPI